MAREVKRKGIAIRIDGIDEAAAALNRLSPLTQIALRKVVRKYGLAVRAGARQRVPVRTGELRRSISMRTSRKGLSARVTATKPHGTLVELGTVRMTARPFLHPAAEQHAPDFQRDIARELTGTWDRAVLKTVKGQLRVEG